MTGYTTAKGASAPFLPLTAERELELQQALLETIKASKDGLTGVMSAYTKDPIKWQAPAPARLGQLSGVKVGYFSDGISGWKLEEFLKEIIKDVKAEGRWSLVIHEKIRRVYGQLYDVPHLVKPKDVLTEESIAQFVLETLALSGLPLTENESCYYATVKGVKIGVDHNVMSFKDIGLWIPVDLAMVSRFVYLPRASGYVEHYGAYDRVYTWAEDNFLTLDNYPVIQAAASILKLCGRAHMEVQFEQALHHAESTYLEVKYGARKSGFSDKKLDDIRDIWYVDDDKSDLEKFLALGQAIMPDYLDSTKFKEFFKKLPDKEMKFNKRTFDQVERGLVKFATWFMNQAHTDTFKVKK